MLLIIIGIACIIILLILIAAKIFSKNRIKKFRNNYSKITLSMTKAQVIESIGNKYTANAINGQEILIWKIEKNSFIEREMLTKFQSSEMTVTVTFENNIVVSCAMT